MKKYLLIIIAGLFLLSACDKIKVYTEEQKNAREKITGNYHAYLNHEIILAVISFSAHYIAPHEMLDGKTVLFDAHGECFFSDAQYPIPDEGYITCYYAYSKYADTMYLYNKGGINDKKLLRAYNLCVKDTNTFILIDNSRVLTFEKVK